MEKCSFLNDDGSCSILSGCDDCGIEEKEYCVEGACPHEAIIQEISKLTKARVSAMKGIQKMQKNRWRADE